MLTTSLGALVLATSFLGIIVLILIVTLFFGTGIAIGFAISRRRTYH